MLCSESADKPGGSNWLDRLRSRKGLSTGADDDDLGIDHFLRINQHLVSGESEASIPNGVSETVDSTSSELDRQQDETANEDKSDDREGEWYGVMSDVLSELFNFGRSDRSSLISRKRLPRKQINPSHCPVPLSNSLLALEEEAKTPFVVSQAESLDALTGTVSLNSDNKKPAAFRERRKNIVQCVEEEDDERGDRELIGFSRSEVTVIDTSFEVWKSDKLIFRRNNVWKVRDKKGKSRFVGKKKKRNGNVIHDSVEKSKKPKHSTWESGSVHTQKHRRQIEEVSEDMVNDFGSCGNLSPLKSRKQDTHAPGSSKKGISTTKTSKSSIRPHGS